MYQYRDITEIEKILNLEKRRLLGNIQNFQNLHTTRNNEVYTSFTCFLSTNPSTTKDKNECCLFHFNNSSWRIFAWFLLDVKQMNCAGILRPTSRILLLFTIACMWLSSMSIKNPMSFNNSIGICPTKMSLSVLFYVPIAFITSSSLPSNRSSHLQIKEPPISDVQMSF